MEFGVRQFHWYEQLHGISWNSMTRAVPWNSNCKINIFDDKRDYTEFHARVSEIPWNSMWNCSCQWNWHTPSSMEFHNCSCHRNWRTPCPMEFHGIPWNCSKPGYDILTIVTDELLSWVYQILTHWGYRIGLSLLDVVACRMVGARPLFNSL